MTKKTTPLIETDPSVKPQLISIVAYVELQTNDHAWLFDSLHQQVKIHGLEVQSLFTNDTINTAVLLRQQIQKLYATSEALFNKGEPLSRIPIQLDN